MNTKVKECHEVLLNTRKNGLVPHYVVFSEDGILVYKFEDAKGSHVKFRDLSKINKIAILKRFYYNNIEVKNV